MNPLDFHVLLALAEGPLYGYAIADAVAAESGGTFSPRAGSLYRVLARLMGSGLVDETATKDDVPAHPGRERRYYELTRSGRRELVAEARRLRGSAALAEKRLGIAPGRT